MNSSFKGKRKTGQGIFASLMLVNRTRRRKKFLQLAIWEVFPKEKQLLMQVDKHHVLQQLYSVSVDFNFSSSKAVFAQLKKT